MWHAVRVAAQVCARALASNPPRPEIPPRGVLSMSLPRGFNLIFFRHLATGTIDGSQHPKLRVAQLDVHARTSEGICSLRHGESGRVIGGRRSELHLEITATKKRKMKTK